jgi:hypothetical protein
VVAVDGFWSLQQKCNKTNPHKFFPSEKTCVSGAYTYRKVMALKLNLSVQCLSKHKKKEEKKRLELKATMFAHPWCWFVGGKK